MLNCLKLLCWTKTIGSTNGQKQEIKPREGKIKERDRGTLLKPRSELVERNTVATSNSHGDWASNSLLLDFIQTQTLTFSDLGLKSINVSLYTRFSPNPNPYSLSLWSGSRKDACMGVGISGELRFFLCFCWWVWVEYARSGGWESLNFEIWEREFERLVRVKSLTWVFFVRLS